MSIANMNTTNYANGQDGNNVAKDATRLLSIRLDSPSDSTVDVPQSFRIDIKAYAASKF